MSPSSTTQPAQPQNDDVAVVIGNLKRNALAAAPKVYRSSYTKASAEMVQPIIDKMLLDRKDVFVPSLQTGYSTNTLYGKLNDGLLWLMHNNKPKAEQYRTLRTQVSMRRMEDGVLIYYKAAIRNLEQQPPSTDAAVFADAAKEVTPALHWRDTVKQWLQRARPEEMVNIPVTASEEDKAWLQDALAEHAPEAEAIINDDNIRIIK